MNFSRIPFLLANCLLLLCAAICFTSCQQATAPNAEAKVQPPPSLPLEVESPLDGLDSLLGFLSEEYQVPGLSIALLTDGQLRSTKTYGLIQEKYQYSG